MLKLHIFEKPREEVYFSVQARFSISIEQGEQRDITSLNNLNDRWIDSLKVEVVRVYTCDFRLHYMSGY